MNGYTWVFDRAVNAFGKQSDDAVNLFSSFRSQHEIYGFIDNGDKPYDAEADTIARSTDITMYNMYRSVLKDRKMVGYAKLSSVNADYSQLDSRHIMMFVLLFSQLGDSESKSIVEIGGGFGNWLALNVHRPFGRWTIIDLPHLGLLQKWYLDQQGVDPMRYDIVSAHDYDAVASKSIDLVIGTHSLSEFSFDVFRQYYEKVITKARYLFYCYHNTMPSPELIKAKLDYINCDFTLVSKTISENGNVSNCLYRSKAFP
jgi:hypothetical protein